MSIKSECEFYVSESGPHDNAAVNAQHSPRYERCRVGGEPKIGISDILRSAEAAHRRMLLHGLTNLLWNSLDHFGRDESRRNGVGADLVSAKFSSPNFGHADDPRFGRDVVSLAEVTVETDHARSAEDHASHVSGDQQRSNGSRAGKNTFQVDVDNRVELIVAERTGDRTVFEFDELAVAQNAGVIYQDVGRSHLLDDLFQCRINRSGIGYIHVLKDAARLRFALPDIPAGDAAAFARERFGGCFADPVGGAGDDRHFILQAGFYHDGYRERYRRIKQPTMSARPFSETVYRRQGKRRELLSSRNEGQYFARDIVVIGSLNADLVQQLDRLPKPGETMTGGALRIVPGGKGANQACAAAMLGGSVKMLGQVGNDAFGPALIDSLKRAGVDVANVHVSSAATGTAVILVLPGGENVIMISPGSNGGFSAEVLRPLLNAIVPGSIVLTQLEIPLETTRLCLETARERGAITILDPAPAQKLPAEVLRLVDYLTPNQTEAAILLEAAQEVRSYEDAEEAGERLRALGSTHVILKLGSLGVFLAGPHGCGPSPGFRVTPIDSTAAGDTFNGALAVALSEGKSLEEAARFANAAAALSVTRSGAQSSIPSRAEAEAFLLKFPIVASGKIGE